MNNKATEKPWTSGTARAACLMVACASVTFGFVSKSCSDEADSAKQYPPGEFGKVVRLGEEIVSNTSEHPLSKQYVGNSLNCTSCHLEAGRHKQAGSFLETAAAYPAWPPI